MDEGAGRRVLAGFESHAGRHTFNGIRSSMKTTDREDWPTVHERDDGIRPAGDSDQCFYCRMRVGQKHNADCVIVHKLIEMRVSVRIEKQDMWVGSWVFEAPHAWASTMSEFHKNASSWCANNFLLAKVATEVTWEGNGDVAWAQIESLHSDDRCLCDVLRFTFVRVVDDTPRRKLQELHPAEVNHILNPTSD